MKARATNTPVTVAAYRMYFAHRAWRAIVPAQAGSLLVASSAILSQSQREHAS